ncbi:AC4 protein [Rhynchosia golden mosaic Havana virus-[Cuba:Havana:28:2007]]|uniref:AC4 protein n=1 Tax=Rhynchosia golden mosaic Havana virus-[Cuba:Havana:28:2007] TaxID=889202 RepID=E2G6Y8_9GEMI|nr:AC4 protein [Rhynchosia golden mosaic Havana virus-[Cuba:Havana:28:2007]]ADN84042.1 AC4 protein [Rhynchosia golden mosaic Havana virus-[Cuba:Havana:28:2007]]
MGNLIFTCSSSSKANTSARITDSSTWYPQPGQHISIQTYRELNQAQTSSPTSTRMEIHFNGESFKSTAGLLEEDNKLRTTHMQRR